MTDSGGFSYRDDRLCCEGADLAWLAAEHGTPTYVYSRHAMTARFAEYREALSGIPSRVCYAVKANSNLSVLRALAENGAGFDIVSGGELFRVLAAGGNPSSVVFSGVGKSDEEIAFALEKGIHSFNCESEAELESISRIAVGLRRTASIAMRVNPDVDAATHPYISTGLREHKFGIDMAAAENVYARALSLPNLVPNAVSCHIGSQLLDLNPLLEAADKMLSLVARLRRRGVPIESLDLGGGLGVPYRPTDQTVTIGDFVGRLRDKLTPLNLTLMLEPGRSIVAEAGVLLCRVLLVKQNGTKTFVIVDAGMNDLLRPALYQAHHEIVPVHLKADGKQMVADVVGPVCESGDFFARDRLIAPVQARDLVAIRTAGAYGFVLSSNYNSRPRACELLVSGTEVQVARRRETYDDLIRGE